MSSETHSSTKHPIRDRAQTFLGGVIDNVEDAETPPIGKLVINEVERPSRVWSCFHQERRSSAHSLAAGSPLAHRKPFFPIKPVDAVDP
jgi:hypothetical protein